MEQISSNLDEPDRFSFYTGLCCERATIERFPFAIRSNSLNVYVFHTTCCCTLRDKCSIHSIHRLPFRISFCSHKSEILSFRYCVNFDGIAWALAIWSKDSWKSGFIIFVCCMEILWRLALNFRILDFYKF